MIYNLVSDNKDILGHSGKITWSADGSTLGYTLSFDSYDSLRMGQVVSFYIDGVECFRGTVVRCTETKFKYSYTCFDYAQYLKNEVIKQFNDVDVTTALKTLFSEFNIYNEIIEIPTKINKFYVGDTISNVIDDMLEQASNDQGINYFYEMQTEKLIIKAKDEICIYPKYIVSSDFSADYSIENLKNKIVVSSGNEKETKIQATAEDSYSTWWFGINQKVMKLDDKDVAQAQNIANNVLANSNRTEHSTSVKLIVLAGAREILPNRYIYLSEDKLNGWYRIKSVNHNISSKLHTVDLSLEW